LESQKHQTKLVQEEVLKLKTEVEEKNSKVQVLQSQGDKLKEEAEWLKQLLEQKESGISQIVNQFQASSEASQAKIEGLNSSIQELQVVNAKLNSET
jgi:predicted  nucleic acid-binding Zn-ribbon protein